MSQTLGWFRLSQIVDAAGNALSSMFRAASSSSSAAIVLAEDTDNGTNTSTLQAASSITANRTITLPNADVSFPAGVAGSSTLADLESSQTFSGAKAFAAGALFGATSALEPEGASAPAKIAIAEQTSNGTNVTRLQAPASLTANRTVDLPDASVTFPAGAAGVSTLMDLQTAQNIASVKTLAAGGGINLGGAGSLGITGGVFQSRGVATTGGANTTAHGLGRTPTIFQVALDGMPAGALAISAVSADATNINWTDSAAGGTVTILAM